jgi:hypothetical protein
LAIITSWGWTPNGRQWRWRERGFVDESAGQEVIVACWLRALGRTQARKPRLDAACVSHKQHGNAPSILPSIICTFKVKRNI